MSLSRWIRRASAVVVLSAVTVAVVEAAGAISASSAPLQRPATASNPGFDDSEPRLAQSLASLQRELRRDQFLLKKQAAEKPCTSKLVDVNLTRQALVASACGRVFTSTWITSGRAGLRTPTGTFVVFKKKRNVYFISPWPRGNPNYYPPMHVAYALEFLKGGFYLHNDPDQPITAYGPGSQNGPYASHGCVHVPYPAMVALYAWAGHGTVVRIHY
ncbi:MAG TPA: L,D-transpeptidase [Candidatus Dormibacteraeota bacterium]